MKCSICHKFVSKSELFEVAFLNKEGTNELHNSFQIKGHESCCRDIEKLFVSIQKEGLTYKSITRKSAAGLVHQIVGLENKGGASP